MNSKNKIKKDNNNVRAMQKTCLSIKHKVSNYKRKKNTIKKGAFNKYAQKLFSFQTLKTLNLHGTVNSLYYSLNAHLSNGLLLITLLMYSIQQYPDTDTEIMRK